MRALAPIIGFILTILGGYVTVTTDGGLQVVAGFFTFLSMIVLYHYLDKITE